MTVVIAQSGQGATGRPLRDITLSIGAGTPQQARQLTANGSVDERIERRQRAITTAHSV
jgi:hypothetical protein